jgi:hypothetical protein
MTHRPRFHCPPNRLEARSRQAHISTRWPFTCFATRLHRCSPSAPTFISPDNSNSQHASAQLPVPCAARREWRRSPSRRLQGQAVQRTKPHASQRPTNLTQARERSPSSMFFASLPKSVLTNATAQVHWWLWPRSLRSRRHALQERRR